MPRKLPAALVAVLSLTVTADAAGAGYATRTLAGGLERVRRARAPALSRPGGLRHDRRRRVRAGHPAQRDGVRAGRAARANGRASRAEQRMVRARAGAAAPLEPGRRPTEEALPHVRRARRRPGLGPGRGQGDHRGRNEIATKPYKYGGGHGRWNDSGYDCSGSVSYVLHAAGLLNRALDSTGFMSWGERGRGTWVTIRDEPGPRLHDRRRTAVRHQRPQADGQPLERADALRPRLPRAPPRGTLGGNMALAVLLLLLLSAFAGLVAGRRRVVARRGGRGDPVRDRGRARDRRPRRAGDGRAGGRRAPAPGRGGADAAAAAPLGVRRLGAERARRRRPERRAAAHEAREEAAVVQRARLDVAGRLAVLRLARPGRRTACSRRPRRCRAPARGSCSSAPG